MNADRPRIVVDPAVAFGQPLVKGTPAETVGATILAGETVAVVADEYNLTRGDVLVACWFLAWHGSSEWLLWKTWADAAYTQLRQRPVDYDAVPDPPTGGER